MSLNHSILVVVACEQMLLNNTVEDIHAYLSKQQSLMAVFSWIKPTTACQWTLPHKEHDMRRVIYQFMEAMSSSRKIDWGIISADNRQKKILCADMESTMIQEECLSKLACNEGDSQKIASITHSAMEGRQSFQSSFCDRINILKGTSVESLDALPLTPTAGAHHMIRILKKNGAKLILLSGGLDYFARKVAKKFNFDAYEANSVNVEHGKLASFKQGSNVLDANAKGTFLLYYAKYYGCKPEDVVAVGDGANDIVMLEKAGTSVAYKPHKDVGKKANMVIQHTDMLSILYLLGYDPTEDV